MTSTFETLRLIEPTSNPLTLRGLPFSNRPDNRVIEVVTHVTKRVTKENADGYRSKGASPGAQTSPA
jgi:hypothetical protein